VSEWLAFQAILLSPDLPQWGLKISIPAVGALLALAAALAAACFVRAFGVVFLGRPRVPVAGTAAETDLFSRAAMLILAALCLAAGVLPSFIIDGLAPAVSALVQGRMPEQSSIAWLSIVPIGASRSSYSGLVLCFFILVSTWISVIAVHRLASHRTRRAPAWDCGFPDPSPTTQYGAASFAQPIRRVFGTLLFHARERVDMPPPGDGRPARFDLGFRDLVWDFLYAPVSSAVAVAADRFNHLQFLTIRRYLSLVFGALVLLLLVIAAWL